MGEERPGSQEVINDLTVNLGRAKELRAACIVSMANFVENPTQDIISIHFDHINGDMMNVAIPYSFKGFRKKLVLGDPGFMRGDKRIVSLY